jgi:hypothetical protein
MPAYRRRFVCASLEAEERALKAEMKAEERAWKAELKAEERAAKAAMPRAPRVKLTEEEKAAKREAAAEKKAAAAERAAVKEKKKAFEDACMPYVAESHSGEQFAAGTKVRRVYSRVFTRLSRVGRVADAFLQAQFKSDAKKAFALTEKELASVRFMGFPSSSKIVYALADLQVLAEKKRAALGPDNFDYPARFILETGATKDPHLWVLVSEISGCSITDAMYGRPALTLTVQGPRLNQLEGRRDKYDI